MQKIKTLKIKYLQKVKTWSIPGPFKDKKTSIKGVEMARRFCKIAITEQALSRLKSEAFLSGISFSEYAGRILESEKNTTGIDPTFLKKLIEDSLKDLKASSGKIDRGVGIDPSVFESSVEAQVALLIWIKEFLTEFCYAQNEKASVPATGTASKKAKIMTENLSEKLKNGTTKFL